MAKQLLSVEKRFKLRIFIKYSLWRYLLVVASTALCCYLTGKWIEGIAFCCAHIVLRYKFRFQYHSKSHCLALTNFIIWACIPLSLPLAYSLLYSIPLAFFVCWIGNEEQEKIWLALQYRKLKNKVSELEKELSEAKAEEDKVFNIENCTREEMLERCKEIGLNAENTELAVKFFVDKIPIWEIAKSLNIEYDSANMRKKRLKKKLKVVKN